MFSYSNGTINAEWERERRKNQINKIKEIQWHNRIKRANERIGQQKVAPHKQYIEWDRKTNDSTIVHWNGSFCLFVCLFAWCACVYWCQNGQLWTIVTKCWKCKPIVRHKKLNHRRANIKKNSNTIRGRRHRRRRHRQAVVFFYVDNLYLIGRSEVELWNGFSISFWTLKNGMIQTNRYLLLFVTCGNPMKRPFIWSS